MEQIEKLGIFEDIVKNNWTSVVFADMMGIIQYANSAAYKLYGYDFESKELNNQNVDVFNSHLTINTDEIVNAIISEGGWSGELIQQRKDKSTLTALLTCWIVKDANDKPIGIASNSKDITDSKKASEAMAASLREKEILLSEVHHRVKNNLQLVSSLLNLQSSFIEDVSINEALSNLQSRIRAMSFIHEKLYTSNLANVSVREYAKSLFRSIAETNAAETPIELELNIDECSLELEKMVPLGLMLNELITNSIKHAFTTMSAGKIGIQILEKDDQIQLRYSDNGIGFQNNGEDAETGNSFGALLIDTFAEQLEGKTTFTTNVDGTCYEVSFPK